MHADQHGTAIIAAAAVLNALRLSGKDIARIKVVACGVGTADLACLDMLMLLGVARDNVFAVDSRGVLVPGRAGGLVPAKARYARDTSVRTLAGQSTAAPNVSPTR